VQGGFLDISAARKLLFEPFGFDLTKKGIWSILKPPIIQRS
jgi:hypothetical protein